MGIVQKYIMITMLWMFMVVPKAGIASDQISLESWEHLESIVKNIGAVNLHKDMVDLRWQHAAGEHVACPRLMLDYVINAAHAWCFLLSDKILFFDDSIKSKILLEIIKSGDTVALHTCLQIKDIQGNFLFDVNHYNYNYGNPLLYAVAYSQIGMVKILLKHGADIDKVAENYDSALMFAIKRKNMAMIEILLHSGSSVNQINHNGITPLMIAAHQGSDDICRLLLRYKADVMQKSKTGKTVFDYAQKHEKIIKMLQAYNAFERSGNPNLFEDTTYYAYESYKNGDDFLIRNMLGVDKAQGINPVAVKKARHHIKKEELTNLLLCLTRNVTEVDQVEDEIRADIKDMFEVENNNLMALERRAAQRQQVDLDRRRKAEAERLSRSLKSRSSSAASTWSALFLMLLFLPITCCSFIDKRAAKKYAYCSTKMY